MTNAPLRLGELAASLPEARLVGAPDTVVSSVFQDSRRALPGSLFAVRRGERSDGRAFVGAAAERGATALLVDEETAAAGLALPALVVRDVRRALGQAATIVYGRPFDRLAVIGVTGTNGKTTTTQLIASLLAAQGARPAVLGTLGCRFEDLDLGGSHTTPEADEIARIGALLVARGATHLAMEVSSHALALDRVEDVRFAVAAFTNLTHDHLDFHGTMAAYGAAKARLFLDLGPGASVINVDDPFGATLAGQVAARGGRLWRVARRGSAAELRARAGVQMGARGLVATIETPAGAVELRSGLVGEHNLENLLVALGVGVALGVPAADGARALGEAPAVPGRLERCSDERDDVLVLVDYAHTPDALARVLGALRPLTERRIWCVFGCGGDRDRQKRAPMGEAAARGADMLVVTNDNPRSESPEAIAEAIGEGVARAGGRCDVVLDRSAAIAQAVGQAGPGDVVLIAGKGHEPYQITGAVTRPFDDRAEARQALARRRGEAS
jgi:UDP-N-acetylmuramoyl-L-alanyl-D-glutamate--2,6-diaminopimelate ligase